MNGTRGILAVVGTVVMVLAPLTGCAATPGTTQTVFVTETAAGTTGGTTPSTTGSPASTSSGTSTSAASPGSATRSTTTGMVTSSGGPFVTVDPLKLDCAKILSGSRITEIYGAGVPSGTARVVEPANPERKVKGRLKCQYGVSDDRSTIAISVIFAQFDDAAAAKAQVVTSVDSETGLGAAASKTTVQNYPADVMLRDGGFLILNYDTWNLSVVVADNVLAETQLPKALTDTAETALTNAIR